MDPVSIVASVFFGVTLLPMNSSPLPVMKPHNLVSKEAHIISEDNEIPTTYEFFKILNVKEEVDCVLPVLIDEIESGDVVGARTVMEVIGNRVISSKFPNTFCGVVKQGVHLSSGKWIPQFEGVGPYGILPEIEDDLAKKILYSFKEVARIYITSYYNNSDKDKFKSPHNFTNDADHFYSPANMKKNHKVSWISKMKITANIRGHIFLKDMRGAK